MTDGRLKLYHGAVLVGIIRNAMATDILEMSGFIDLTSAGESYKCLFHFVIEEGTKPLHAPFDQKSYFENWFIEDESGKRVEIATPGMFEDGEMIWRP